MSDAGKLPLATGRIGSIRDERRDRSIDRQKPAKTQR